MGDQGADLQELQADAAAGGGGELGAGEADTAQRLMGDALKKNDYRRAKEELAKIPADSVYRTEAKSAYDSAVADAASDVEAAAKSLAAA